MLYHDHINQKKALERTSGYHTYSLLVPNLARVHTPHPCTYEHFSRLTRRETYKSRGGCQRWRLFSLWGVGAWSHSHPWRRSSSVWEHGRDTKMSRCNAIRDYTLQHARVTISSRGCPLMHIFVMPAVPSELLWDGMYILYKHLWILIYTGVASSPCSHHSHPRVGILC